MDENVTRGESSAVSGVAGNGAAPDVVVVGGGIVGCASAYALAREGLRVQVFEQDRVAAHASGGSAGILSTRDKTTGTPYYQLAEASLALYPTYAARLREETGIDVEYQQEGVLTLLRSEDLERGDRGFPPVTRLLDRVEVRELEPNIGEQWAGGILHCGDGQVNTGRLTRALAEAAARRGVRFDEGVTVTGFLEEGDTVRGVRTSAGDVRAGNVVLAAGPWSGLLAGSLGRPFPVFPVKGQIVWARTRPRALQRPIFAGCYLVPKYDLGIAIGASEEMNGFDETPTLEPAAQLIETAVAACPMLRDAELSRVWASIRPGTPDEEPILGPVAGRPGLILATGHHANGILLSLISGELVANWVLGRPQPFDVSAFRVERF